MRKYYIDLHAIVLRSSSDIWSIGVTPHELPRVHVIRIKPWILQTWAAHVCIKSEKKSEVTKGLESLFLMLVYNQWTFQIQIIPSFAGLVANIKKINDERHFDAWFFKTKFLKTDSS